uniref:I/LWEQ domain-containing protein n=2 Tax=Caenorhabditis japonica TaxID=281687 RepID=A0A8R1I2S5_CAEJA
MNDLLKMCCDVITHKSYSENLVYESTRTAGLLPSLITSIRESQNALTSGQKFKAQSRLIRDSHKVLENSVRLFESARTAVPAVNDAHQASSLDQAANRLATSLAELRTAVNDAQQLNFSQQLIHSEELIKELDEHLVNSHRKAVSRELTPVPTATSFSASSKLMAATSNVGSGVAQLITAATSPYDERYIGTSAVELAQGLRDFVDSVVEIVTVRSDIQIDKLIVSARSVVHESGRVFDRVRERSAPTVLTDTALNVSTSLKQVISCLPDTKHIEKAIIDIQSASTSANIRPMEVRQAANQFIESTSQLVATIGSLESKEAVDIFVRAYCNLHCSVIAQLRRQADVNVKTAIVDRLEQAQRGSIGVLETLRLTGSPSDATLSQQFTLKSQELATIVNQIVELSTADGEEPWQRECDAALRRIQAVYHVTQHANVPLNENGYFASLQSVSDDSKRLGEAMTGMARHAKANDTNGFCMSVRNSADALCHLAESASHSAYLVGISDPSSTPGRAALIDPSEVARSVESINSSCVRIESGQLNRDELINNISSIAKQSSSLAQICRNASEKTQNPNVKKHLVSCAMELASKTANLVNAIKVLDSQRTQEAELRCRESCAELRHVSQQLLHFADKPDFAAIQGSISSEGRSAQTPILQSSREMLDASAQMIQTAKSWASAPQDEATWQRMAVNSKQVSDSIMRLVGAIHEAAPGQLELENAISRLSALSGQVEKNAMDVYANSNLQHQHGGNAERQLLQQVQHITSQLEDKVDELRSAAVEHGEHLPKIVRLHCQMVEDLADAACCAAGMTVDSNQQTEIFDKCKTVVEAELAMMVVCRESGGNPNALHAHNNVNEAASLLKHAIGDMRQTIAKVSSEQGAVQGLVDTISSSIANTDVALSAHNGASFADSQTRMTAYLEEMRRTAIDMPALGANDLGAASLNLSEKYRLVAGDTRQAVGMLPDADNAQRLKVAVQKLGTSCIDAVTVAGGRRAHPDDERIHRQLTAQSRTVVERAEQVLAALHSASRGTQACINAANTVSGIIGDLDTTIMFATSGSLNSSHDQKFPAHRDAILKTAKALVEDTKALVAGAASNQEQLAVAAQNAVRTIVNLSDAVKNGAVSLTSENSEAQVLIIHAVRDVAAALTSLIQATKNASGLSLQHQAMGHLKEAAKVMVTNVACLLKTVKSVEDKHHQGTRAVEAAVEAINFEIRQYDIDASEGAPVPVEVRSEHLQQAADSVAQITQRVVSSADTVQSQEDVIAVANISRTAVRSLLAIVRSIASEADTAEIRYSVLDTGRDVANNVKTLLVSLHTQMVRNPGHDESRRLLLEASRGVANSLSKLVGVCTDIAPQSNEEMESAAVQAESELLGAASSIEAASLRLAELRPRQQTIQNEEAKEEIEFDENILSAAKSITSACQTLMRAASNAQRELAQQGRADHNRGGVPDYQWSEGLISAARVVVAAVHQLCEAANALMQGQASEEKLISAAKQVASSTAHLLVACNVKADMDSQAKRRLQAAGQAVKNAAEKLVQSARQVISRDDRNIVISDRLVSGIAQVMDAQEEVLRKEKELGEARHKLAHLNKARYEREEGAEI